VPSLRLSLFSSPILTGLEGGSQGDRQARHEGHAAGAFRGLSAVEAMGPGRGGGAHDQRLPRKIRRVRRIWRPPRACGRGAPVKA
jgi:hypothetical protein